MKLHRSGLQWAAYGEKGQCGPYLEPIMDKRVYRTQMMYPARTTGKRDGRCCYPWVLQLPFGIPAKPGLPAAKTLLISST